MEYQSNALWPPGVYISKYGDNISTDVHATQVEAAAVCGHLCNDGFGGERKHFPLLTWVSCVQQPPMVPRAKR